MPHNTDNSKPAKPAVEIDNSSYAAIMLTSKEQLGDFLLNHVDLQACGAEIRPYGPDKNGKARDGEYITLSVTGTAPRVHMGDAELIGSTWSSSLNINRVTFPEFAKTANEGAGNTANKPTPLTLDELRQRNAANKKK